MKKRTISVNTGKSAALNLIIVFRFYSRNKIVFTCYECWKKRSALVYYFLKILILGPIYIPRYKGMSMGVYYS